MKTILFRSGAPPGNNDETQAGQGLGFGVSQTNGLGLQRDDTTLTVWAAYAARRRLRRKRSGSRWPAEVVA